MRVNITLHLASLFVAFLLTACEDSSSSSTADQSVAVQQIQILGAGIKGPLAFADSKIFRLDMSRPGYYDKNSPISSAITNSSAQIAGLSVPANILPPYVLTIGGSNAIDLNTGKRPIISTLVTVITQEMLNGGRPIYTTPLTTLVFQIARNGTPSSSDSVAFTRVLDVAANRVARLFAVDTNFEIDVFKSPLVINDSTVTPAEQEEAVHHRAALEAFAAKVHRVSLPLDNVSPDDIIEQLARDIQSDDVIDNTAAGISVGDIDAGIMLQNSMNMLIPNTAYRIKDITRLMQDERIVIGTDRGPVFQTDSIIFPPENTSNSPDPAPGGTPGTGGFPIQLRGSAPEEATLSITVSKPADALTGVIALSVIDADNPGEGEIIINGNNPVILFGAAASNANNEVSANIAINTPAAYWIDGENTLQIRHTKTSGFTINTLTVDFHTSATATLEPLAALSESLVDFGSHGIGEISAPFPLTLTNTGTAPMTLAAITLSPEFLESNNCNSSLLVGESCIINISFVPTASGTVSGTLAITGNMSNNAQVILSGTGDSGNQPGNPPPATDPNDPAIQFFHDFDIDSPGIYTEADLSEHWGTNSSPTVRNESVRIVQDPNGTHGQVMDVIFKKGGVNYDRFVCCSGVQWKTPLEGKDELYFSYEVMFEDGFDFVLGGKLPGLYGGKFIGGGKRPTGYDGWSGRMMFHAEGTADQYIYHSGMSSEYGEKHAWKINGQRTHFTPGQWHTIEIRYVINTPGASDGIIQTWLDGELTSDVRDFKFRKTDDFSINGIIMTTYFGGHTEKWAPPKDQHVFFDKFTISTEPVSH